MIKIHQVLATLGYGEMAQKEAPAGTPLRRHIDAVVSAGLRAKSLVERILAFSRGGTGERVPVHVQSVVDEALDGIAAALPPGILPPPMPSRPPERLFIILRASPYCLSRSLTCCTVTPLPLAIRRRRLPLMIM